MSADATSVPGLLHEYSSFASDINLVTDSNGPGDIARYIKVTGVGSGSLVVKMARKSLGGSNEKTLTVTDGEELRGQFVAILSGSDIASCRVGW